MKINKHILLLIFITLIFFAPFFIKPGLLTQKDNDLGRTYIPLYSFFKESVTKHGQFPLWRPSQMMGESFAGNPLSSLTYPLNLIFLFFTVNFAAILYQYIHFVIASLSVYILARAFKFSNTSSISAAIFYSFSLKFLFHLTAGHVTMLAAYSFFPLAFYSLKQAIQKIGFKYLILGSLSLAFMYITYPTTFFYSVLFLSAYTIYFLINSKFENGVDYSNLWKIIFRCFLIFLFAILLSSAALMPNLEFGPLSTRSALTIEDVAIPIWNVKKILTSLLLPHFSLKEFDQESILFLGIIPGLLGATGFLFLKRIQKLILALSVLSVIIYMVGISTPFFKLAYDFIPLVSYSRVTTRPYFIIILIFALLSAHTLERIKNKKIVYFLITLFLIESIALFTLKLNSIGDLDFKKTEIYEFLATDKSLFRVYCTTYCFNPQLLSKYKIQMLAGETPIQDINFINYLQKTGGYKYDKFAVIFPPYQAWQTLSQPQPSATLLGEANVKYVVSTYELTSKDFAYLKRFDDLILYVNKEYKDRIRFKNQNGIESVYYSPNIIYTKFDPQPYERELIFSENYYPGWKAFVNKNEKIVEKENELFRKVPIPAFSQEVLLKYRPKSFLAGKVISLGTLLFMLLIFLKRHGQKN